MFVERKWQNGTQSETRNNDQEELIWELTESSHGGMSSVLPRRSMEDMEEETSDLSWEME